MKKLYEIRHYPSETAYSKSLSLKLRSFNRARKLVKKLQNKGVDAFYSQLLIRL